MDHSQVEWVPEIFKASRFGGGHTEVVAEACEVRLAYNAYAEIKWSKSTVVAYVNSIC